MDVIKGQYKVYARQVPPENQRTPLDNPIDIAEECGEFVTVTGNRDFNGYITTAFKRIEQNAEEAMAEIGCVISMIESDGEDANYDSIRAVIEDLLQPIGRGPYTDEEIDKWHGCLCSYTSPYQQNYTYDMVEMLTLMTGLEYCHYQITGCSQGDWQDLFFPKSWGKEYARQFEAEYFNTGDEWVIHEGDSIPKSARDIEGYYIYTHSRSPRVEIAEHEGVEPEDVLMYEFSGWTNTAVYTEDAV